MAIEVLPQRLSSADDLCARFEREARTRSRHIHPHICTHHDVGRAPGEAGSEGVDFLVMELIEGETLASRLERGPLPIATLLANAVQIAGALAAAHRVGIVHADLKPANLVLTESHVARPGSEAATARIL